MFDEKQDKAYNTYQDLLVDYEFNCFILNLRSSLDPLAKLVLYAYSGIKDGVYGFLDLNRDLESTKKFSGVDNLGEYILLESKKWIYPVSDVKKYEKELLKYPRTKKEYRDIHEIIWFPKINDLRNPMAHGKRTLRFHRYSEPILEKDKHKKWCRIIPNKAHLKKGQIYTTYEMLEYCDKVFKKALHFHLKTIEHIITKIK